MQTRERELHQQLSLHISKGLTKVPELLAAAKIAAYWPIKGEVDIRPALETFQANGTEIYLPRVRGVNLEFIATPDLRLKDAPKGPFGIPCPDGEPQPLSSVDCVLVPALGFDPEGNRLGRGKGYYDRALGTLNSTPIRIGVGFSDQIVEEGLNPLPHDVQMHLVVTEKTIYRF